jgi:hypothetical protein
VHITLRIYRKLLLYNNQYIVAKIRSRRIVCLGHLIKMDLGQMVKQLFMENWEKGGGQADPD